MPTGIGKSLTYQALPLMFDHVRKTNNSIILVVSPLISLMTDQVSKLNSLGVKAICLCNHVTLEEEKDLTAGKYSIVYGSPEVWLMSKKWRSMLISDPYKNVRAVAVDEAHVIRHWGKSSSNKQSAFRECFGKLMELRSLVPTKFVVLTATATKVTKQDIFEVLLMKDPYVIAETPNKSNIIYSVYYINKDDKLDEIFKSIIVGNLLEKGKNCERTIIYRQTIRQCSLIYSLLKEMLGSANYLDPTNKRMVLLEMLHSCTPPSNKKEILSSFQKADGCIRVLVATIAFGMGIDCQGVKTVIHFGPSKNVESYIQESGRVGRDGFLSRAYILYKGMFLSHVDKEMKVYIHSTTCRRNYLLSFFDFTRESTVSPLHLCCDNCAKVCECGSDDCRSILEFPKLVSEDSCPSSKTRLVSTEAKASVKQLLTLYHRELKDKLSSVIPETVITPPKFLLGFSQLQINQVIQHCSKIFSVSHIYKYVEIWDKRHAWNIYNVLNEVFGDMDQEVLSLEDISWDYGNNDDDDELWDELVNDEDLLDLALEYSQLSISDIDSSYA